VNRQPGACFTKRLDHSKSCELRRTVSSQSMCSGARSWSSLCSPRDSGRKASKVVARAVFVVAPCCLSPRAASACDVPGPAPTASNWLRTASRIAVARAGADHAVVPPPSSGGFARDGVPLACDRSNRYPVPYPISDTGGSCYSDWYKRGAEYLLILFRQPGGGYSARSALAPLNEQLRGPDDPWLRWVREGVGKLQGP